MILVTAVFVFVRHRFVTS